MKHAVLIIAIAAIGLGGCAMGKTKRTSLSATGWYKANVSDSQRAQEVRYCQRSADRDAARDQGYGMNEGYRSHNDDGRYRRQMNTYDAKRYRYDLYASCMRRYGYTRGKPKQATPEQQKNQPDN